MMGETAVQIIQYFLGFESGFSLKAAQILSTTPVGNAGTKNRKNVKSRTKYARL